MSFQIGDVVYLKSGSPAMTVNKIIEERGNIECTWFIDNKLEKNIFVSETLTKENPRPKPKVAALAPRNMF